MPRWGRKQAHTKPDRLLDADQLYHFALKTLSLRAQTSSEVLKKLSERAKIASDVSTVMEKLRDHGFLNDDRFAEGFATARKDTQGFGKGRVLRDLKSRKVVDSIATRAVEDAYSGTDEPAMAEAFLLRKFRGVDLAAKLKDPRHLRAAFRRLRYAGFSASAAMLVLKKHADGVEELENEEAGFEDQEAGGNGYTVE